MHCIEWKKDLTDIIHSYQQGSKDVEIGVWKGLKVYARMTHIDATDKKNIRADNYFYPRDMRTWRIGNIAMSNGLWRVRQGSDLTLLISLKSSVNDSYRLDSIPPFQNSTQQEKLRTLWAIMHAQLSSMVKNNLVK